MRISDWSSDVCSSDLCDGIAHQPARLSLNRRNLNIARRLRHGALTSTRIERTEAAARQAGSNQEQGKEALHTTRLTKRSGTTITFFGVAPSSRSEEHTSELQSLMRISYAVFCLKKKRI